MSRTDNRRYTTAQVLRGLKQIWDDTLRCWFPPDANTKVAGSSWGIDELDFAHVIFAIESFFDFKAELTEWKVLIDNPNLTFQALAEFIAERAEAISLEPLLILGRPCKTAGIFRALESAARLVKPAIGRFGPSTPIRQRFRGSALIDFWDHVRWLSEDKLPILWSKQILRNLQWIGAFGIMSLIAGAIFVSSLRNLQFLEISIALLAILFVVYHFVLNWINPLPPGIHTFGDLARAWTKSVEAETHV